MVQHKKRKSRVFKVDVVDGNGSIVDHCQQSPTLKENRKKETKCENEIASEEEGMEA